MAKGKRNIIQRKHTRDILNCIIKGISYCRVISKELKLKEPYTLRNLQILKEKGVIRSQRQAEKNINHYFITDKGFLLLKFYYQMDNLLKLQKEIGLNEKTTSDDK